METQLATTRKAFEAMSDSPSLTKQIQAKKPSVETLYTELQKSSGLLKNNMSSLLGIVLTFNDGE